MDMEEETNIILAITGSSFHLEIYIFSSDLSIFRLEFSRGRGKINTKYDKIYNLFASRRDVVKAYFVIEKMVLI